MKTVAAVYTGQGLAEAIKKIFTELLPEVRLVNIIDDGLIHDVIRAGAVDSRLARRLTAYIPQAQELGAEAILTTCSSVGEVVDIARGLVDIPIIRIDEAMAREAAGYYGRIGVIATLPTTLAPTMRLLRAQAAAQGRTIQVLDGLASGAYQALIGGSPETHDRLILESAQRLADRCDAIVLAQGSMARMEASLAEQTGKPVLSSPRRGILVLTTGLETR